MADQPSPDWLGPTLAAVATAFAGILGWLGLRAQAKAPKDDPQKAINAGFHELLGQMRLELIAASKERNHLNAVLEEERRVVRIEREAWRAERERFVGEIAQLQAVAEGFERLLRRNGIALPERKAYGATAPQVVQTTLRQEGTDDAD